jgi:hypothetical protein
MKKILTLALMLATASAAHGDIYTWRDGRGTAHYTNSLHEIPARYLRRAKLLDVATGKKMPLSAAQAVAKAPATAAQAPATAPTPLATPVPPAAPAPPTPPAANGVIPTATAPAPPPPAPAAMATIPQPQPTRGYVRRRMHSRGSTGEEE